MDYHGIYNQSNIDLTALNTRFHYDQMLDTCTPFHYNGCGGNWNKFHTEAKCTAHCSTLILLLLSFKLILKHLEPYRETHHNYLDALFTTRLGLGYITGVIELILGAIFYIMCLPLVRKSGYFQVREEEEEDFLLTSE